MKSPARQPVVATVPPAAHFDAMGFPALNAVPIPTDPGPWVRPVISTYSTAASTTVIATSRIVAMIGDTPRFRAFLQLRSLFPKTFIPLFLRRGRLTRRDRYGKDLLYKA